MDILVVGGGAAGYFAAIHAARRSPKNSVRIVEAGKHVLRKVKISGGGRCNVTHACFDNRQLSESYPRGSREVLGPFSQFNPQDTVTWFESRGVALKAEADGRMFPVTDSSQSIIDCLQQAAVHAGVTIQTSTKVTTLVANDNTTLSAELSGRTSAELRAFDRVILATGSSAGGYELASKLGHTIVPCVPSLFTFVVSDPRIDGLAGLSVQQCRCRLQVGTSYTREEFGPLLITHWGVSGPAIIRLSAWGARPLHDSTYRGILTVEWCEQDVFDSRLDEAIHTSGKRKVFTNPVVSVPQRLWQKLCEAAAIPSDATYASLNREKVARLREQLTNCEFQVAGKGEFKDEFVTCGGIELREVHLKTMQSKVHSALFFAGEVLDVDGVTGGFNFQFAWTSGYIAGVHAATTLSE